MSAARGGNLPGYPALELAAPRLHSPLSRDRAPASPSPMRSILALLPLPLLLCACAEGGEEDRPQSEIRVAARHHFFGLRSQPGFQTFPVDPAEVLPDRGFFNLFDDSTYTVTRSTGTSPSDGYSLEQSGAFSVRVTGSSREPTVFFRGGYGLPMDNHEYFFTDRVSNPSSTSLGMFYGTRVRQVSGGIELAGGWHLLSLHVIFSSSMVLQPSNVGRGAHGSIDVAAGDPGTSRMITGMGSESSGAQLELGGSIQDLLQGGNSEGELNLTVSYRQLPNGTADSRVFEAAAGKDVVLAVDADETDEEAGILFLVRHFDAMTPATEADLAGDYLVGAYTLFVNPTRSGTDGAFGRLNLTEQGGFRFDMVGSRGIAFTWRGTYTLADDGGIELMVDGTNETWFAAISRDYNTIAIVDDVVETRANGMPELNILLGVREQMP